MTLFGFVLVLTAAFCHAIWNYYVKRINGGPELVWLFSMVAVIIYLPVALYIVITEKPVFGFWQIIFLCGSVILHLSYLLLLQQGYRKGDLSLVYPIARSTGPFLSTSFAVVLLGEPMTPQIAVGGATIILGVLFLTGGFRGNAKHIAVSSLFGLMVGVLIGSYTVWDAYAVSTLMISPLLLDYMSSFGRSLLLSPIAWKRREQVKTYWRDHRSGVMIIAVFHILAYTLVLYALTFTPVVYVAPTREVSVLVTVMMGSLLLNEGDLKRRMGWATLILLGVALLASA